MKYKIGDRVYVRPIQGYEGEYVVSNRGDIFSLERFGNWRTLRLKPRISHNGYERVTLTKNNSRGYFFVHRLVALAFIENPYMKATVNHIDGNKTNNHVGNLEWATQSENSQHAVDNNLTYRAKGEEMSKVLTEKDVTKILDLRKSGMTHRMICEEIGRPQSTVQCILNGRRWSHVTGIRYGIDKPL